MAPMFGSWLRIVSLVTLIAAAVVVSGAVSTAAALLSAQTVDRCCDGGKRENSEQQLPCATPDCTCLFCLSAAVLNDVPLVEIRPVSVAVHPVLSCRYHLKEYPSLIEYPPETA